MKILITGATGFLGKYLVRELYSQGHQLFIYSRRPDFKIQDDFRGLENLVFIQGDITALEMIPKEQDRQRVMEEVEVVIHAAALYDIKADYAECFMQNVVGTQNVLHLLSGIKKLKAFYYISTIAVGDPEKFFLEENLMPKRSSFSDRYSETKYLAEVCVRDNISDRFVTRIIRPGIIVGDSQTGEMSKTDGPYYFIKAFNKFHHILKRLPVLVFPFNPRTKLPIIPVDHCARFIALLLSRDKCTKNLKTYHLLTPDGPSISEFLQDLNVRFGLRTHYFPMGRFSFNKRILKTFGIPQEVESFMFSKLSYDKTSTLEDLPELEESSYAQFKTNFLK